MSTSKTGRNVFRSILERLAECVIIFPKMPSILTVDSTITFGTAQLCDGGNC